MNWILRYTEAVVSRIPGKQKQDVSDELNSLLEEEAEAHFDTPIDSIASNKLKQWIEAKNHPSIAAVEYMDQQNLISARSYPLFRTIVKFMAIVCAVLICVQALTEGIFNENYSVIRSLLPAILGYGQEFLKGFAIITLVFHFAGKYLDSDKWLNNWKADDLPNPNQKWKTVPYSNSIFALICTLIVIVWFSGWLNHETIVSANTVTFLSPTDLSEEIRSYMLHIYAILIGSVFLNIQHLFTPIWKRWTLVYDTLLALCAAGILFKFATIHPIIDLFTHLESPTENMVKLSTHLDKTIRICLGIAGIVNVWEAGKNIYRITKFNHPNSSGR